MTTTKKKLAVIDTLPKGVNREDMKDNGDRTGPLYIYGGPFERQSIMNMLKAWDVKRWWLVNHTGTQMYDGWPGISTSGGPILMLLFGDGKWRYCRVGGMNGPPWFYCPWDGGIEAPNGEAAWRMHVLEQKIKNRVELEAQVKTLGDEISALKGDISKSMQQPERRDEGWDSSKK